MIINRWIPGKARFAGHVLRALVKGEDEFVSGFLAGLNSVLQRGNADGELEGMSAICTLLPLFS